MQVLLHLPDHLGKRFQQTVPVRKRSAYITALLEKALPKENRALAKAAMAVEKDIALHDDLSVWDETARDGLQ
jgi:hypothetical protein